MRCPKCGAVIENGKDYCFMCGTKLGDGSGFGSGSSMSNSQQPMFSEYNPSLNENYYKQKEAYNNRLSNYRGVNINKNIKAGDKDIFDFVSEHKMLVRVVGIIALVIVLVFGTYKFYQYQTSEKPLTPVLQDLYYEVDSSFKKINGNQSQALYTKSSNKGNDCSISVLYGSSTSGDHVNDLFESIKINKTQSIYDDNLNVIDAKQVPLFTDGSLMINNNTWYYLYEYYRPTDSGDYSLLKFRYLSSVYKGYYYDITLVNNSNDSTCTLSLDKFIKTLSFVES